MFDIFSKTINAALDIASDVIDGDVEKEDVVALVDAALTTYLGAEAIETGLELLKNLTDE